MFSILSVLFAHPNNINISNEGIRLFNESFETTLCFSVFVKMSVSRSENSKHNQNDCLHNANILKFVFGVFVVNMNAV